jgi:hypothetical protein
VRTKSAAPRASAKAGPATHTDCRAQRYHGAVVRCRALRADQHPVRAPGAIAKQRQTRGLLWASRSRARSFVGTPRVASPVFPCHTPGMVVRLYLIPAVLAAASVGASCGDDGDDDCEALQSQAFNRFDEVIRASQGPCTQDSDCVIIGHSSACHDSCSRVVLTSSLEILAATRTTINERQCRDFSMAECRLEIPPCVPPGNAVCLDGICSEMY